MTDDKPSAERPLDMVDLPSDVSEEDFALLFQTVAEEVNIFTKYRSDNGVYDVQIVCFIDILGFSAAIIEDADRQVEVEGILAMLIEIKDRCVEKYGIDTSDPDDTSDDEPSIKMEQFLEFSAFSDSIILSHKLVQNTPESFMGAVINVPLILQDITHSLLERGYLCRGGAVIDRFYHRNGVAFGPGLIRAYELETKVAKVPRIVFDGIDFIMILILHGYEGIGEHDGVLHFDPFYRVKPEKLEQYREIVQSRMGQLDTENAGVLDKWKWILKQIDERLATNRYEAEKPLFEL